MNAPDLGLPLDSRGYWRLVGDTVRGAMMLHRCLSSGEWEPFRVVPLPAPDINIVCFGVFLATRRGRTDVVGGFARTLRSVLQAEIAPD